jgi:hypothetical protein
MLGAFELLLACSSAELKHMPRNWNMLFPEGQRRVLSIGMRIVECASILSKSTMATIADYPYLEVHEVVVSQDLCGPRPPPTHVMWRGSDASCSAVAVERSAGYAIELTFGGAQ